MITTIPTPFHLMPVSVVIIPPTRTQEASGAPETAWSSGSITVAGNLQPGSSREAVTYATINGVTTYDLYIAPIDTSGTAVSLTASQWKESHVTYGGETYRVLGEAMNPITNGCLLHLVLEKRDRAFV